MIVVRGIFRGDPGERQVWNLGKPKALVGATFGGSSALDAVWVVWVPAEILQEGF